MNWNLGLLTIAGVRTLTAGTIPHRTMHQVQEARNKPILPPLLSFMMKSSFNSHRRLKSHSGVKSHGVKSHGVKSHSGVKSHGVKSHGVKSHGVKSHGVKSH